MIIDEYVEPTQSCGSNCVAKMKMGTYVVNEKQFKNGLVIAELYWVGVVKIKWFPQSC